MRWLLRVVVMLGLLAVLAVAGLLLLPGERIARVALDQIEAQTGRQVRLNGDVQLSYYPILGARTGAVEIANADWSQAGPLLRAEALKIGVDLAALLQGDIKITGLELLSPQILMERHADGRANWEIGVDGVSPSGQSAPAAGADNALALSLDRALISGGQLRYLDHAVGSDMTFRDISLDLSWPVYRGAADFALSLRPNGAEAVTLTGDVSDLAALIEGQITDVAATAQLGGSEASFTGQVGMPLQVQGRITLDSPDTGAALAAAGLPGIPSPQGLGRAAGLSADVTLTEALQLSLREMQLTLDQHQINGGLDLDLAQPRPYLTARLAASALDLNGLSSGNTGTATTDTPVQAGWSKAPIDASALHLLNADISLTAPSLSVAGLSLQTLDVRATLDRARLVVKLNELQGYGGGFAGQVVANNRNGLSVGGDVKASGVEMKTLLGDLVGVTRFTGQAEARVAYLGVGESLHQIMNSLSGDGHIHMGRGTIEGIDLDSLMRQGLATGGTTVFDQLSASFTMENGDLQNPDLLLQLPVVTATGKGRVGLGKQDIDYLFTPQLGSLESQGGLAIPVRIKGPWAAPKVWPDLEKAVDLNLKEEKAKAKAELENKVKKELGIKQEEGESLEDAAKRTLEDELLKGLGKLLR
ncbi:MAG: AsmA family protein [Pseudomonadota bacterium]|nr:AsmA family protein [Pseudomonadota bacterium]